MEGLAHNIRVLLLLIFCATLLSLGLIFAHLGLDWQFIIYDAIISATILTASVWTGLAVVRAYPTKVGIGFYALAIGVVCGLVVWYLNRLVLSWLLHDEVGYIRWLRTTQMARLVVSILVNCWLITLGAFYRRSRELEARFKNVSDAASLHREAELFKLRQQLQPHFLYNSLNSISALILLQPEQAQEMIGKLSDFLRNSVKREARDVIPVEEELEYIKAYLDIETVRFGDRLNVVYDREQIDNATIPPFLLQPILENAIKFGLYGRTGEIEIRIHLTVHQGTLILTISNPYDPANKPPSGTGFGLEGIRRRLYLLYGRTDLLETSHNNDTFITVLKIPQSHVYSDIDRR